MTDAPALRVAPAFLTDPALIAVLDALPGARLVGGCVRDALIGRDVSDIDVATPDPPDEVVERLAKAGLRAIPTGIDHGTVTALSGGRGFEVTTLRRDVTTDGRHATVAYTEDWRQDAARRDFTFNALSMARDGAVYDYFEGIADLHAGRVRFVGDPATRIAEDYLRILRFFRFQARYGTAPPNEAAMAAIEAGVPGLARLSAERVWSELKRLLTTADPTACLALMQQLGVLDALLPGGGAPDGVARLIAADAPADPILRLAGLARGTAEALAERLKLSGAEQEQLAALLAGSPPPVDADDATLRRCLADTPLDSLAGRVWLDGGDRALLDRLHRMERPVFPLQGRDLAAAGMPPGPAMGDMLRRLRAWWLDGGCVADEAACLAELARLRGGDSAGSG